MYNCKECIKVYHRQCYKKFVKIENEQKLKEEIELVKKYFEKKIS